MELSNLGKLKDSGSCQSSCRYPKDFRQGFFTQSVNSLFSTFLKDQRFFADATSP
ncbi:hypothetical protein HMPREF1246_0593 [Acidaminococcus sp. BV3L6]|uniref:Uncharacterized protein n=1 Tax=Acidaminococcus intestini (strain RyC-MR95) TaxID=568816 RepID=G4Q799_ACIIR|nr:hypothetical protein Acin_0189 [Acidaminococcus intestini RyC-MR95]ERL16013.1 hypothetical protein HMPREF1246_0593 [Acidaminococcus sp. BV3L6]